MLVDPNSQVKRFIITAHLLGETLNEFANPLSYKAIAVIGLMISLFYFMVEGLKAVTGAP